MFETVASTDSAIRALESGAKLGIIFEICKFLSESGCNFVAINSCGDNSAGISGAFTRRVKPGNGDMGEGFIVAGNADGGRRPGLTSDNRSIGGEKAFLFAIKFFKSFAQAGGYLRGKEAVNPERDKSGGIRARGERCRRALGNEVGHSLSGCRLRAIAGMEESLFDFGLEVEHFERRVTGNIVRENLNNHSGVGPLGSTGGRRHSVDDQLSGLRGGGNDKSAGTHAEGIDGAVPDASEHGVFSGGEVFSASFGRVILQAVNQLLRVLEAHSNGKSLRFKGDSGGDE